MSEALRRAKVSDPVKVYGYAHTTEGLYIGYAESNGETIQWIRIE